MNWQYKRLYRACEGITLWFTWKVLYIYIFPHPTHVYLFWLKTCAARRSMTPISVGFSRASGVLLSENDRTSPTRIARSSLLLLSRCRVFFFITTASAIFKFGHHVVLRLHHICLLQLGFPLGCKLLYYVITIDTTKCNDATRFDLFNRSSRGWTHFI